MRAVPRALLACLLIFLLIYSFATVKNLVVPVSVSAQYNYSQGGYEGYYQSYYQGYYEGYYQGGYESYYQGGYESYYQGYYEGYYQGYYEGGYSYSEGGYGPSYSEGGYSYSQGGYTTYTQASYPPTTTPTPGAPTPTINPSHIGTLVSNPNPCQIPGGSGVCTTTIGWSTAGGVTAAEVWVQDTGAGGAEVGFAGGTVGNQAAPWIQGPPHSYTFKLYDTSGGGRYLLDTIVVSGNPSTNSLPIGSHESVNNSACRSAGWAYDPDSSSNSLEVRVYRDGPVGSGTLIYSGDTVVLRSDVNTTYGISGSHGFNITFDSGDGLFDSAPHELYVYAVDENNGVVQPLNNTPRTITCGNTPPTATPTSSNPAGTLNGSVLIDGTTGYDGATIQVRDDNGVLIPGASATTTGGGNYTLTDGADEGDRIIEITGLTGNYTPTQVRPNFDPDGGGPLLPNQWTDVGLSGNTYSFDFTTPPSPYTIDWWISNASGWTQVTDGGDIRQGQITETIPGGNSGSTTPATVYHSTDLPAGFGSGTSGGFISNSEYGYNGDPRARSGFFSYTFFINRARVLNVPLTNISTVCPSLTDCEMTGLSPSTIYWADGDLTLTSYDHPSPGHILLLVNGRLTIKGNVNNVLPAIGNLLVIAAKNDVTIDRTVGGAPTVTTPHIQAILTSERNVILDGTQCAGGVADLRLNFEGSIVTNSLKPFATNQPGAGEFIKERSLCANDATYPVLTIKPRYDFVPQLTDFYKVPSVRWKEVAP